MTQKSTNKDIAPLAAKDSVTHLPAEQQQRHCRHIRAFLEVTREHMLAEQKDNAAERQ